MHYYFRPEMWKWRMNQVLKSISAKMRAGALESQAVRLYGQNEGWKKEALVKSVTYTESTGRSQLTISCRPGRWRGRWTSYKNTTDQNS